MVHTLQGAFGDTNSQSDSLSQGGVIVELLPANQQPKVAKNPHWHTLLLP
jgi:hypothetical protein